MAEPNSGSPRRVRPPSKALRRRWLQSCLIGWLVLIATIAGLAQRTSYAAIATKEVLSPLAASLATVVIGGLFLERYQRRIEAERLERERKEWLTRNQAYLAACHDSLRINLLQISLCSYSIIGKCIEAQAIVPPEFVLYDFQDRVSRSRDSSSHESSGPRSIRPVDFALQQASQVRAFGPQEWTWSPGLLGIAGLLPQETPRQVGTLQEPSSSVLMTVIDAAEGSVRALEVAATRVLSLTGELISLSGFEPGELKASAEHLHAATTTVTLALADARPPPSGQSRMLRKIRGQSAGESSSASAWQVIAASQTLLRESMDLWVSIVREIEIFERGTGSRDPNDWEPNYSGDLSSSMFAWMLAPYVKKLAPLFVGMYVSNEPTESDWQKWLVVQNLGKATELPQGEG